MQTHKLRIILSQLGLIKSVMLLTVIIVMISWLMTWAILGLIDSEEFTMNSFLVATIVPLIISPTMSYFFIKLVLELHKLEEKMRTYATIDFLTKIPNRREFIRRAGDIIKLCQRNSLKFSLLYLDIDHFKSVNDTFGHSAGDAVMTQIGPILDEQTRSSDTVGRIGGEEFAISLVGTTVDDARIVAEKVRKRIEKHIFDGEATGIDITVSIGGVVADSGFKDNLDDITKKADQALYEAKRDGRNCTRVYPLDGQ